MVVNEPMTRSSGRGLVCLLCSLLASVLLGVQFPLGLC